MAGNSSLGTNFGDGVRVGPGLRILNKAEGSQLAPISVYDIVPAEANDENVVLPVRTVGAGFLTLAPGAGTTRVSKFGLTNVIELDVPRGFAATLTGGATLGDLIVTGYDMYFNKMQEQVTTVSGETVRGKKAFKWITSAYYSNLVDAGSTLSIGTSEIFGLPWRVDCGTYVSAKFNDPALPTPVAGQVALVGGEADVIMLNVPLDSITMVSPGQVNGGTPGILRSELDSTATGNVLKIRSSDAADTSQVFYTVSSPAPQIVFNYAYQDVDGDGNPVPSTATTADVRGTVSILDPDIFPDGVKRLTVFAYVLGSNTTALIEPSIQSLPEYAYKTIPNDVTVQGYAQFSGT